ncbi:MAG: hypothetical protein HKO66_10090 [Saprospiraceae bacterium]|nr:hypothetical protein [Bacteroidia bacterium]NNL92571.1 hypothetical protein [Saprospiraceae bacterium]
MKLKLIIFSVLFLCNKVNAQNFDNFKEKDPFSYSGNVTIGTSFYNAEGRENRRNPFAYYISASPTISIYEIDIPISFTYRDQQGSVSNPFQRFTINPSYKWIKLSVGNTSLDLSSYTLSGQYIKGAAIELTPENFRIKAAYGELENPLAQIDTLLEGPLLLPTYKRKAAAVSIGYGSMNNYIDLIFFKAKDDVKASDIPAINQNLIKPEENIVVGTSFAVSPINQLYIKANVGASAHTANQESASEFNYTDSNNSLGRLENAFTVNLSSKLQFAGNASINYKFKKIGIGFDYKRVDPLYKSLGTYYFQEDYQNFTMTLNFSALNNKVRFRGSAGIQENNLSKLRSSTRKRKIFNGNLTLMPSRTFTTSLRMANFTSDKTPVLNTLNDSIQFTQTTETYSITPVYSILGDNINSTFIAMVNYQKLVDLGLSFTEARLVDNYIANLSYSMYLKATKLAITTSLLGNRNMIAGNENSRLGATVTASKKFFDNKLSVSTNVGFTRNFINKIIDGNTITGNIGLRYNVKRTISIGFNTNILHRKSDIESYRELRGTAKVSYQFNSKK